MARFHRHIKSNEQSSWTSQETEHVTEFWGLFRETPSQRDILAVPRIAYKAKIAYAMVRETPDFLQIYQDYVQWGRSNERQFFFFLFRNTCTLGWRKGEKHEERKW